MSSAHIVPAEQGAAAQLAAVHARGIDAGADLGETWDAHAMADILAMPGARAFVAHGAGAAAGLVILRLAADEADILTLAVAPEHRRQGHATALVQAACAAAVAGGAVRMNLEVAEGNAGARALYRGLGFVDAGFRRGYYATRAAGAVARTALVMRLDLDGAGNSSINE